MNEWQQLISGVAFPIAVAAYLLVWTRKSLDDLKKVIENNTKLLEQVCNRLDKLK